MENSEKRTIVVYVGKDYVILPKGVKLERIQRPYGKSAKCKWLFGDLHTDKQGRITEIFDIQSPMEKTVETVKDDPRFLEQCHFELVNLYGDRKKAFSEFDGNFLDALRWLDKNMDAITAEGEDLLYGAKSAS
jgi:hypothetical protein